MSQFAPSSHAAGNHFPGQTGAGIAASAGLWRGTILLISLALIAGALFAPAYPFTSDGAIHAEMARAFADRGVLHIAMNGGVEGAPPLLNVSTHILNGAVYPQYPSGYGIAGAPFYAALGLRGLVIVNALSAGFVLLLTYYIAARLYDEKTARLAVPILAFATFFSNYAFGVWPHMFSLFLWFAAAALAVKADQEPSGQKRLILFGAAGLIVGFGVCVRVDTVLAAPAIFIWLRLFARPQDRASALAFLAALIPGLIAAAMLNDIKFGVFSPFYYGPKAGPDNLASYLWLAPIVALFSAATIFANIPKLFLSARQKLGGKAFALGAGGAALIFLASAPLARDYLYSVYVLTIDLQGYNSGYMQPGVEYNEYGHLLFWGFPKRALLQSAPFAVLAILPIVEIFRGRRVKAHSLAALIILAPICFYALKQWHGGGAYNMRYFLPALPFISILAAYTLLKIAAAARPGRAHILGAVFLGAFLFVFFDSLSKASPALFASMALYPQLVLAALLAAAALLYACMKNISMHAAKAIILGAIVTLSYSAMINISDESSHEKARAEQSRHASLLAQALPDGALAVTTLPVLMTKAIDRGVSVYYVTEDTAGAAVQAISAFERSGRCVYLHNSLVKDILTPTLEGGRIGAEVYWAGGSRFAGEPKLQLFTLAAQQDRCAPRQ